MTLHSIQAIHVDVGFDYYVVNQAKWLIISNSTFGFGAAWLNKNVNEIIAPKYWADIMLVMVTGQQEIHTRGFNLYG
jgi:hypothetical protein